MVNGKTQEIISNISANSYEPIEVKQGIPVKWILKAKKSDLNGCNNTILIPEFNIKKKLTVGDNIIRFTPTKSGHLTFTCWMGMIKSTINVVDASPIAA